MPNVALPCLLLFVSSLAVSTKPLQKPVPQTPDVIEAYRVCQTFERLLGKNLDFAEAYEATFATSKERRRAIAIADGEFGELEFAKIDDDSLIKAYQLRMQLFYLTLPLAGPSDAEEPVFFPPEIRAILQRKPPSDARQFAAYVSQLGSDVTRFRAHLDQLAASNPAVAKRLSRFKAEALRTKLEPPLFRTVEPIADPIKEGIGFSPLHYHYQINNYRVAKEQGAMRIVGIKFFNRLF